MYCGAFRVHLGPSAVRSILESNLNDFARGHVVVTLHRPRPRPLWPIQPWCPDRERPNRSGTVKTSAARERQPGSGASLSMHSHRNNEYNMTSKFPCPPDSVPVSPDTVIGMKGQQQLPRSDGGARRLRREIIPLSHDRNSAVGRLRSQPAAVGEQWSGETEGQQLLRRGDGGRHQAATDANLTFDLTDCLGIRSKACVRRVAVILICCLRSLPLKGRRAQRPHKSRGLRASPAIATVETSGSVGCW